MTAKSSGLLALPLEVGKPIDPESSALMHRHHDCVYSRMKFADDEAIENSEQDLLGRNTFVEKLARAISNSTPTASFVMALYGPWGCGKSSVKNLLLDHLKTNSQEITIIEFSPWLISGQEQLIQAFFRDLWVKLNGRDEDEKQRGVARTLAKLSAYSGIISSFTKAGAVVVGVTKPEYALPAATVAAGVEQVAGLAKRASSDQKTIAEFSRKTLAEGKQALNEAFRRRPGTILIVIDDIDRLTQEEIRLVFRLIRSNADFPKFIFLLLFDREVVAAALNNLSADRGEAYLEKIVQVGFDVPAPAWGDILEIMRGEMTSVIRSSREAKRRYSEERWTTMAGHLQLYFETIRAVRRVTNSVRFTFSLFQHGTGFDANVEDLFALETLRNYEPKVYSALPRLRRFLTRAGLEVSDYLEDRRPGSDERKQQVLTDLLALTRPDHQLGIRQVLRELFPNARWQASSVEADTLLREMRVGHPDYFARYFQLIVPSQSIRSEELGRAIKAARSQDTFERVLRKYLATGRFSLLVQHLSANAGSLASHVDDVVAAIFAMGDDLPNRNWYYLGTPEQNELANLARNCLEQISDRKLRAKKLASLVKSASGLSMPYHVVVPECDEDARTKRPAETFLLDQNYTTELRQTLVDKIQMMSESAVVLETTDSIGALLHVWAKWGNVEAAGKWLLDHRENGTLMWSFLWVAVTWDNQVPQHRSIEKISFQWLLKFISAEELDSLVDALRHGIVDKQQSKWIAVYDRDRERASTHESQS
jgi:predicted KAP-like P-loop ATPase